MKRAFPSWIHILLALALYLHLACTTAHPVQPPIAFPVAVAPSLPPPAPPGMVYIPGGTFMMGCTQDIVDDDNDKPLHQVSVKSFFLDRTLVSQEEYRKCWVAGKCFAPGKIKDCSWSNSDYQNESFSCVPWWKAKDYCEWVGKRLLFEAEWEYAARGGTNNWDYPWGKEMKDCTPAIESDACQSIDGGTAAGLIESRAQCGFCLEYRTPFVQEWVEDCYHDTYHGAPIDGRPWITEGCRTRVLRSVFYYSNMPINPWGTLVLQNGYMKSAPPAFHLARRYHAFPYIGYAGFRCAKAVE